MKRLSSSPVPDIGLTPAQRLAQELDQAGEEAERLGAVLPDELARLFAELDEEWGVGTRLPHGPRASK